MSTTACISTARAIAPWPNGADRFAVLICQTGQANPGRQNERSLQFLPDRIEHAASVVRKKWRNLVDAAGRQMVHNDAENGVRADLRIKQPDIAGASVHFGEELLRLSDIGMLLRE